MALRLCTKYFVNSKKEIVHLAERIKQAFKDHITLSLVWKGKELDKQVGKKVCMAGRGKCKSKDSWKSFQELIAFHE